MLRLPALVLVSLSFLIVGCSNLQITEKSASGPAFHGALHGGQQPVSGASVQLYTVGTTGDGSPANPLLPTPAITRADGSFDFSNYTPCPSQSSLLYLAATGGNPGLAVGTSNPAIAALAVIGTCADLNSGTFINLDEVTTVAAASALAPYLTSVSAIGSAPSDASQLASAFTLATQLANSATGQSPGTNLPAGYTSPTPLSYTIADAIAPCVNSNGTDGNCATLFGYTTAPGAQAPTDVVGALRTIALYPTQNISNIVALAAPASPYQPIVTGTPGTLKQALVQTTTTLSFSSLTFPNAASTYATPQQDLVVTNTGTIAANFGFTPFTITGTNPTDFSQTSDCTTLAPGASCDVLLVATPSATGTRTATLNVAANTTQPQSVALSVIGTAPSAGPVTLSGLTSVPDTSGTYSPGLAYQPGGSWADVTVTNSGTTPLTFNSPAIGGGYKVVANTCAGQLAAGASCIVSVQSPGSPSQSNLILNDDASAGPQTVALYFGGPASVSGAFFPGTAVGASSTGTITENSGTSNGASFSGTISGPAAADFSPSPAGCSAAGSQCAATITFKPSAPGMRVARITTGSVAGNYLPLVGVGTGSTPVNGPSFTLPSSASLSATYNSNNFASASTTLTLANNGNTTLNFPSLPIYSQTPGVFSQTNNCGNLAAGASCSIVVTYSTSAAGPNTGSLIVKDTTSGLSKSVSLSGTVTYPAIAISPATVDFGRLNAGTSATQTFTVTAAAGGPVGRPVTAFVSNFVTDYSFPNGNTCPASSTGTCTLTLAFNAPFGSSGSYNTTLVAQDTVSNNQANAAVTAYDYATGTASFSPYNVTFADTRVGNHTPVTTTLSNSGSTNLNISAFNITTSAPTNTFVQTNNCPASLAPAASCTVTLYFSPSTTGTVTATLSLTSNSAYNSTVSMSGKGT